MKYIRIIYRSIYPIIKNIIFGLSYKLRNNHISIKCVISKGVLLNYSLIGKYTYIGPYSILNAVNIGNYTSIGPYVIIGGAEHSYWWLSTSHFISKKNIGGVKTVIGNDVWIGAHAVIKQGITIGDGAVIGAGAIVLKNVDPYTIVAGIPAKNLRKRLENIDVKLISQNRVWELNPTEAYNKLIEIEKICEKDIN